MDHRLFFSFISHVQNTARLAARMNGVVGNILSERSESKDYNKKDTARLAVRSFIAVVLIVTGSIFVSATSHAAVCEPPPAWEFEPGLSVTLKGYNPGAGLEFFGWLLFAVMAFAAVLALVKIAISGVAYIAAAGNAGRQSAAKESIWNALIGLILAMTSIFILYTVNPQLTKLGIPELPIEKTKIQVDGQRGCDTTSSVGAAKFVTALLNIPVGTSIKFSDIETKSDALKGSIVGNACLGTDGKTLDQPCMCKFGFYTVFNDNTNTTASCVQKCLSKHRDASDPTIRPCRVVCSETWNAIRDRTNPPYNEITGGQWENYTVTECLSCAKKFVQVAIDVQDGAANDTTDFCACRNLPPGSTPPAC